MIHLFYCVYGPNRKSGQWRSRMQKTSAHVLWAPRLFWRKLQVCNFHMNGDAALNACMKHACSSQTRYLQDSCGGAKGTCRIRLSDCRWRMALFSNFLLLPKVPLPAYNISLETKNYGATDVPCYPHLCGTFIVNTVKVHNK